MENIKASVNLTPFEASTLMLALKKYDNTLYSVTIIVDLHKDSDNQPTITLQRFDNRKFAKVIVK